MNVSSIDNGKSKMHQTKIDIEHASTHPRPLSHVRSRSLNESVQDSFTRYLYETDEGDIYTNGQILPRSLKHYDSQWARRNTLQSNEHRINTSLTRPSMNRVDVNIARRHYDRWDNTSHHERGCRGTHRNNWTIPRSVSELNPILQLNRDDQSLTWGSNSRGIGITSPQSASEHDHRRNKYRTLTPYTTIGFITNRHDIVNFDIHILFTPDVAVRYESVKCSEYVFVDTDETLDNGKAYRCHLFGVGVYSNPNGDDVGIAGEEVDREIMKCKSFFVIICRDIDVYGRILVEIINPVTGYCLNDILLKDRYNKTFYRYDKRI